VDLAGDLPFSLMIFFMFEDCYLAGVSMILNALKGKRRSSDVSAQALHAFGISCGQKDLAVDAEAGTVIPAEHFLGKVLRDALFFCKEF